MHPLTSTTPTNINFNSNVPFDGRWPPIGHLTVEFSARWVNALCGGTNAELLVPDPFSQSISGRSSVRLSQEMTR